MICEIRRKTDRDLINNQLICLFLQIIVIISVLSQISILETLFRPLMYIGWCVLLVYLVLISKFEIYLTKFTFFFIYSYTVYFFYCIILTIAGMEHIKSNYLKLLIVPIIVCVIANIVKNKSEDDFFRRLTLAYVCASTILALYINLTYFKALDKWLNSTGYLYEQKNSASQILGVAVILIYCVFLRVKSINWGIKVLLSCVAIYFIVICALCKCRAVLLALAIVFVLNFFINIKHKIIYLIVFTLIIFICTQSLPIRKFIFSSLNLNNFDWNNLNKFSSNRLELWKRALNVFFNNVLFGVGNYYVDNAYINLLTESGIIGFLIIMPIWIYRIIYNVKYLRHFYNGLLLCMTVFYIVISMLEAYSPFGPGVSTIMFWFSAEYLGNGSTVKETKR